MAEVNHVLKKKLEGKIAIITGGASGVGEATARLFARNGVKAVVIANIQDELGPKVAESIGLTICSYYHCDRHMRWQRPMLVNYFKDKTAEEAENVYQPFTCLKQALKVDHVANAVVFLASDDSAFVTGHDLVVDGGFTASPL